MRMPWKWIVAKGEKFLKGHSYATGLGTRFHWTSDREKARKFDEEATAVSFAAETHGRTIQIETPAE